MCSTSTRHRAKPTPLGRAAGEAGGEAQGMAGRPLSEKEKGKGSGGCLVVVKSWVLFHGILVHARNRAARPARTSWQACPATPQLGYWGVGVKQAGSMMLHMRARKTRQWGRSFTRGPPLKAPARALSRAWGLAASSGCETVNGCRREMCTPASSWAKTCGALLLRGCWVWWPRWRAQDLVLATATKREGDQGGRAQGMHAPHPRPMFSRQRYLVLLVASQRVCSASA